MRFLIVDNERLLSENISRYLSNTLKAEVTHVGTATDAIKALAKESYDLVISDLDLPDDMEGRWISSAANRHPRQKLIIISADQIPQRIVNNVDIKIAAYFEKPFDLEALKTAVLASLEERKE